MNGPPAKAASPVREDHPWTPPNIYNDDDVHALISGGDIVTISSRNGFHVLVSSMNLSLMIHGAMPEKRPERFRDDGTPTRWINRDPTMDQAINNLIRGGGPFVITAANDYEITVSKEQMAAMCVGMTSRTARARKNRQGKFRERIWLEPNEANEKTPTAGTNANQNCSEGPNN